MARKGFILVLLLAAIGGGVVWSMGMFQRPDTKDMMTLYGNVDIRQVNLSFRVGGRIAKVEFEEGDVVKAGDTVAWLDTAPLEDDARVAKAAVEQASATLAKYRSGNRPQEIAVAKAVVAAREAALIQAEKEYQRGVRLLAQNAVAKSEFDAAESTKTQAEANLASAKESLSLMVAGFRQEEINAAEAALHVAEASLQQVQTRLSDARLIAPSDGVLLTRIVEPGAMVSAGQTVATLSLTSSVWVRAYVNEKDLGRVHPGMLVSIHTDSAVNRPYQGHVGFISPESEFTPKSVETPELRTSLVYRLRIIADDPDHGLRQGMPVTVRLCDKSESERSAGVSLQTADHATYDRNASR